MVKQEVIELYGIEIYAEALTIYKSEIDKHLSILNDQNAKLDQINKIGHKLKGSSAMIGCDSVSDLFSQLENTKSKDALGKILLKLNTELEKLFNYAKQHQLLEV